MKPATRRLDDGTDIAYLERPGGSVPVVLLHGITDFARTYEALLPDIAPEARVYALDFRGHGESARPDSRYDADAYAGDVRRFIAEVVGAPALIAGHSLGGVVAVQVAVTQPTAVTELLLEDPPLYFVNRMDDVYRRMFEAFVAMASSLQDGSRSRAEWFDVMANAADPYSGRPGIETLGAARINLRLDALTRMRPRALEDALEGALEWDTDAVLRALRCPVTLLIGSGDLGSVVSADEAERMAQLLAECRIVRVPDVGHLVHDQRPQVWLDALNGLVRGRASG